MFQRSEFTDGDVAEAVESLVTGPDCLDPHRFDCFLSADNTGLLVARSDAASTQGESEDRNVFNLLYKIANMAGAQNRPVAYDDLQPGDYQSALLDDLLVREVLIQNDQRDAVQIKVLLFADYMRGL